MGSIHPPARRWYRCEVVDVQAELRYWKLEYVSHDFHEPGTSFSRYEPVLRFAYDAYLRHHAQPLADVIDVLHHKYVETFDSWSMLPWPRAEAVLREVWLRMGAPLESLRVTPPLERDSRLRLH
ncbi:hypothetical protein ACTJI2_04815 [Pseudoxanthomonas sp. 22568]|jgi:hypothetical protein|uniref:hypothetical protein n=1 Tax=Pseudoxanthomonas TaxID=83618 RepID=UPI00114396B0|nr:MULTISPECIES: hypothetical protein [Pseudoxanthomonas]MBD9377978.1 hypothetical protein [Pseudoxanthomonas sp. PXM04]